MCFGAAGELVELKGNVVVVMLVYHGSLINQIKEPTVYSCTHNHLY